MGHGLIGLDPFATGNIAGPADTNKDGTADKDAPSGVGIRGTPRAGVAPDQNNYALGGDPNFQGNFTGHNAYLGERAQGYIDQNQLANQAIGSQGQGLSSQGVGLAAQAAQLGAQDASRFNGLASATDARAAPAASYGSQLYQQQGQNAQAGSRQMALATQLAALGGQPEGPSAAQAQLQAGTNQALGSQLALARSGRGMGESATGLSQAGEQASGTIAQAANQAAALRAQETQSYRQQQLADLNSSGQQLEQARTGSLGLAQQAAQLGQFDTQTALQQGQMNDAYSGQLYGYGLQGQQLGLQGQQAGLQSQNEGISQQLAAQGLSQQSQTQGLAQQAALQGLNLGAAQAEQQGGMNYENELSNIYGIDTGAHNAQRQLDQQNSMNWVNAGLGLASTAAMAASDRRMKHNVRLAELDDLYRALGGEKAA